MRIYNKYILQVFTVLTILIINTSCKLDNYKGPTQTLQGKIVDKNTEKKAQTTGTRLKLLEISYSDNPQPYYFNAKPNGTFKNTKLFEGKYKINLDGPFVPLLQKDDNGKIIVDNRKTVEIKGGRTEVDFKVHPFLEVKWIGAPTINEDSTVTARVKITRGTKESNYQKDLINVGLYVNRYRYANNGSYNPLLTKKISYSGGDGNKIIGNTISITTDKPLTDHNVHEWWVRVGARTDYGQKRYNYNEPKKVYLK